MATVTLSASAQNPFFAEFSGTPHGTAPFDKIQKAHYEEAIDRGIELNRAEIDAIVNNPEKPTFANTIKALDKSGADLDRVTGIFFNLTECLSDDEMMEIQMRVIPKVTDFQTSITLNPGLWTRVKTVWDNRANEDLDAEDLRLLEETYQSFARNGALLQGADREKLTQLTNELSQLTNQFGQNVLKELNTYEVWLTKEDLDGLPESSIEAAALAAKEKGREGEYMFTLAQPTYMAFLKYSTRRDLREHFYRLYSGRNLKGEYSNTDIIRKIANTRLAIANLLGYKSFADYKLGHTMAQNPDAVYNLLYRLRDAYRPAQEAEFKEITEFARKSEGPDFNLEPWDYSFWSNKLREAKYSYNEEELRPYFELNNVINGVFGLATKLYGLTFRENPDIPVYHPDAQAFEVLDPNGEYMGVIYTDFFPRDSKRPGAWMTEFKGEWQDEDGKISPSHVSIVMNFTKPTESKPSLLTPYEVETFLHEFGHALHGLFASTKYKSLSGTNVYRDFVELPSQFNENYMTQSRFLNGFARHYQTDETIPEEYVQKIITSSQFGSAYACLRQLNFGLVDMAWHSITEPLADDVDIATFENTAGASVAMYEPIADTSLSAQFNHIFSGGYAAGYYSYKWAEVLDADAFKAFAETGDIFSPEMAAKFRDNVLKRGGTVDPGTLYKQFRGKEPSIDALLERDGIKKAEQPRQPQQPQNVKMPKKPLDH